MNTIQQTVTLPANRRLQFDLTLPDDIPAGKTEMLIVFSPTKENAPARPLSQYAGALADSLTFASDPVALQRVMRDEW